MTLALDLTFERRRMERPSSIPAGLSERFVEDASKRRMWQAFLKKNRLPMCDLASAVTSIVSALQAKGAL